MKTVALIIAGGHGQRFWPKSRDDLPKQFLSLDKARGTMLQATVKRIKPLVDIDDIFVITGKQYQGIVRHQLPSLPFGNVLVEPSGRNTAPAIGLGVEYIKRKYKEDCVMYVLPCDHMILNECRYIEILKTAGEFVTRNNSLVTIGVNPTNPNTQYGYIKATKLIEQENIYKVDQFVEKPDLETAQKYLDDGHYYWNAGTFVWKLSDIDEAFRKYSPKQHEAFTWLFAQRKGKFRRFFEKVFNEQEKISIDYAIMEKSDNLYVVTGEFGWDDVGSWLAIERINAQDENNNTIVGDNVYSLNTKNTIISNDSKQLIATIGVDDLVIVSTGDVVMIAKKENAAEIKDLVNKLKEDNKDKYI